MAFSDLFAFLIVPNTWFSHFSFDVFLHSFFGQPKAKMSLFVEEASLCFILVFERNNSNSTSFYYLKNNCNTEITILGLRSQQIGREIRF
jgi:hypothetical protein